MPSTKERVMLRVRVDPEVRKAVQRAANDDKRSLANYLDKLLTEVMAERSYLSTAKQQGGQANG